MHRYNAHSIGVPTSCRGMRAKRTGDRGAAARCCSLHGAPGKFPNRLIDFDRGGSGSPRRSALTGMTQCYPRISGFFHTFGGVCRPAVGSRPYRAAFGLIGGWLGREPISGLYSDQRKDVHSRTQSGLRFHSLLPRIWATNGHDLITREWRRASNVGSTIAFAPAARAEISSATEPSAGGRTTVATGFS